MIPFAAVMAASISRSRQFEPQTGPAGSVAACMRGQAALMRFRNSASDSQPQTAVTAEILAFGAVRMEPLEDLFARVLGNALPMIGNLEHDASAMSGDLHLQWGTRRRKAFGIVEQILDHALKPRPDTKHDRLAARGAQRDLMFGAIIGTVGAVGA